MNWGALFSLGLISIVKFMFAPLGGPGLGLSFFETYFACVSGAILGSSIFYFSAEFFMIRSHNKRKLLLQNRIEKGLPIKQKRKFTRSNKFVVRIKRSLGKLGITFWAPFFLSIPIGSIIAAKFYGKQKDTYLWIVTGIFLNGLITTGISYLAYG